MKEIDRSKLSVDQLAQLEQYEASKKQLTALEEISKKLQNVVVAIQSQQAKGEKGTGDLGTLLMDIRESLDELKDKEEPEQPDFSKPVVQAVDKLEQALTKAIKSVDVKPQVNVKTDAPEIDLSGVEKVLATLPKAFDKAIKSIPKTEIPETDFKPLVEQLKGVSDQLADIDKGVRMKPTPGSMKVTNTDGSEIGSTLHPQATLHGTGNRGQLGNLFTLDLLGYNTITVQCTSAGTATITYEASDDNTTWVAVPMDTLSSTTTAPATTSTTVGVRGRACTNRYFRARISSYTSGQVTAYYTATADSYMPTALSANLAGQTLPTVTTVGTVTNITNQGQIVDNAAFTDGTTRIMMDGFIFDETAGTALTENDGAAARIDSKRAQVITLEDATTRGQRLAINALGAISVTTAPFSTTTNTSVAGSASSVQLVAANASRKELTIQNDSTAILYIKEGTTASTSDYKFKLYPDDIYKTNNYTGRVDGIWASATGNARIAES